MDHQRPGGRRRVEREPVLLMTKDVFDGAIAVRPELLRALTGGLEPVRSMEPPQAHQTETRAIALLGMQPALEDAGDEPAGRRTGLFRPRDQPRGRPLGMRAMRVRHVRGVGDEAASASHARVHGDAAAIEEDFDCRRGEAGFDAGVHQLIRHAVEAVVDLIT